MVSLASLVAFPPFLPPKFSPSQISADNITTLYSDYINPIDLCNRLNTYIVPEAGVQAFLTALFLINGYWVAVILNLPLLAYNAKKYTLPILLRAAPSYGKYTTNQRGPTGSSRISTSLTRLKFSGS